MSVLNRRLPSASEATGSEPYSRAGEGAEDHGPSPRVDRQDVGLLAVFMGSALVIYGAWLLAAWLGVVLGGVFVVLVGIAAMRP